MSFTTGFAVGGRFITENKLREAIRAALELTKKYGSGEFAEPINQAVNYGLFAYERGVERPPAFFGTSVGNFIDEERRLKTLRNIAEKAWRGHQKKATTSYVGRDPEKSQYGGALGGILGNLELWSSTSGSKEEGDELTSIAVPVILRVWTPEYAIGRLIFARRERPDNRLIEDAWEDIEALAKSA